MSAIQDRAKKTTASRAHWSRWANCTEIKYRPETIKAQSRDAYPWPGLSSLEWVTGIELARGSHAEITSSAGLAARRQVSARAVGQLGEVVEGGVPDDFDDELWREFRGGVV
jgi:hypothetical protein